jgi:periplasmic divalent cation tolerance protein
MAKAILVMTTTDSAAEGQRIASTLVERSAAACVQVLPEMTSIYQWQGKVESAAEVLLLIKTTAECYDKVESIIRELHHYETPEIVCVPIEGGSEPYLEWLRRSVLC